MFMTCCSNRQWKWDTNLAKDNYKVYIAGPMRGIEAFNFPAFDNAGDKLEALNFIIFSPADHDREDGFNPEDDNLTGNEDLSDLGFDLREALTWDLQKVMEADLVVVLPGYEKSTGAAAELALANALGTPWCTLQYALNWLELTTGDALQSRVFGGNRSDILNEKIESLLKSLKLVPMPKIKPPVKEWGCSGGYIVAAPENPKAGDGVTMYPVTFGKIEKYPAINQIPNPTSDKWVKGSEVRSVSSTGGEKGTKDARFDLIPADALHQLAEHYGFGARKYADNQWRKGYEWSKSYAAMQRHLNAWWGGEDIDEETGSSHIAAAAWHCFTLLTFIKEFPEFDDRYTK